MGMRARSMRKFHHGLSLFWFGLVRVIQLRLRRGPAMISDNAMQELQETTGLVHGSETPDIRDGVGLSVNLLPDEKNGMIGWRAQTCRSHRH